MNFIFSLAHFCEIHGPTSILCTQLLPPSCLVCNSTPHRSDVLACDPHDPLSVRPGVALQTRTPGSRPQGHLSSDGLLTPVSSGTPSPTDTPPISPRTSHVLANNPYPYVRNGGGPSLLSSATAGTSDSCANCNLTLPKNLSERLPVKDGKKVPVLRSREVVMAGGSREWPSTDVGVAVAPLETSHKRRRSQQLPKSVTAYPSSPHRRRSSSSGYSSMNSSSSSSQSTDQDTPSSSSSSSEIDVPINKKSGVIPVHSHNLTYLSTRFPSAPERFSALRRACVRTLSCESLPTQTGPIFVGDSDAGYTIAYVFRLADPKSRGGRRTYALLCLSSEEKKIVSSYGYVTSVFEGLVARIRELARIASKPAVTPEMNDLGSVAPLSPTLLKHGTSPDGFLRRHPTSVTGKGLAELVGREQLFVEVHACFSTLLGGLARRFGCLEDAESMSPSDYQGIAATAMFTSGMATGGIRSHDKEQIRDGRNFKSDDRMDMEMTA